MQTSNNLSNYENVRVGFTYINCLKIFEYCEGFYNSLENYDIDFSKIVVPECLELFSEQNPLDNQTNISEQELFNMLIYISFVKICFRQAICKEPSLKNPVSFTKYTKILYGVEKHLEQRLHQSVYIENAVCRLYPLKQYNIFYMPK